MNNHEFDREEYYLSQIRNAKNVDDLKEALELCIKHAYSKHYSSYSMDEPRF